MQAVAISFNTMKTAEGTVPVSEKQLPEPLLEWWLKQENAADIVRDVLCCCADRDGDV